jgi:hypothetical protein
LIFGSRPKFKSALKVKTEETQSDPNVSCLIALKCFKLKYELQENRRTSAHSILIPIKSLTSRKIKFIFNVSLSVKF